MAKQLACGEVVPGCAHVAKAASEAELMEHVAKHAAEAHGINEITPDLLAKVKSAVREVSE